MDKMIEHRLAWLAGIIDGEGWIGFRLEPVSSGWAKQRAGDRRRWTGIGWHVAVANTDMAMLAEIAAIADILGAKCHFTAHIKRENRREQGRVTFHTKRDCTIVLEATLPYLITKRAQAELMLRAIARRTRFGHCASKTWVPASNDPDFLQMLSQIRSMNRRGLHPKEANHGN